MTDIRNKRILVTGAASGIGRLVALRLAARGGRLVLWDVDGEGLEALREELGAGTLAYRCDLSDPADIVAKAEVVLEDHGPVQVLVNNAGIVSGRPLLELTDEAIERTFAVNTLALFRTTRAFLPGMLAEGDGHVVTVASAGGLVGSSRLTDYTASKFAAVGFDEALRLEMKRSAYPIRTTVVCPFYINTGMFAGVRTRFPWLLPILEPDDVADRIVRAIEQDQARVIMPPFVYVTYVARLLPTRAFDALASFFGINAAMDAFTGRAKQPA